MSSRRSCLATVSGVRGMRPRAERVGSVGSSGLELASVRVGDKAVHNVCAGDATLCSSDGSSAPPECWAATGGDEGSASEDPEVRRAGIQLYALTARTGGSRSTRRWAVMQQDRVWIIMYVCVCTKGIGCARLKERHGDGVHWSGARRASTHPLGCSSNRLRTKAGGGVQGSVHRPSRI